MFKIEISSVRYVSNKGTITPSTVINFHRTRTASLYIRNKTFSVQSIKDDCENHLQLLYNMDCYK